MNDTNERSVAPAGSPLLWIERGIEIAILLIILSILWNQRRDIDSMKEVQRVQQVQIDSLTKNKAWRVHR